MRNKRLNYLLVPAVLAIWVGVIYVIFFPDKLKEPVDSFSGISLPVVSAAGDQEDEDPAGKGLLLSYPDPFLRGGEPAPVRPLPVLPLNPVASVKPPPPPPKPQPEPMEFLGVASSKKNDAFVALIRFRGATHTLRRGDSLGAYVIRKIQRDTLWAAGYDTLLPFARQ